MKNVSLLWPEHREGYRRQVTELNDAAVEDLRLGEIAAAMNAERAKDILGVMKSLPTDEETIRYRQEIFDDIRRLPAVADGFRAMLPTFAHLDTLLKERPDEELTLWKVLNRMRELDAYTRAVQELQGLLAEAGIASNGLRELRDVVDGIANDAMFRALARDLPAQMLELNEIRSVTLGINVNEWLEPAEVTLVSVNRTPFTSIPLLQQAMELLNTKDTRPLDTSELWSGLSRVHQLSFQTANPMFRLSRDINLMLKTVLRDVMRFLRRHVRISTSFLLDLEPEIVYYLSGRDYVAGLEQRGFPFCQATTLPGDERRSSLTALYSVSLACILTTSEGARAGGRMIYNDLRFDDRVRIYVLTGPNQGGKTTITQAVGQAYVLFQSGLPVPAREAALSPVDGLFTHFPAAETGTQGLGRLGEEASRLRPILLAAGPRSLVLLNESISSTSYTEALYLSRDILKALRYLGCRGIFTTHFHDLAGFAGEVNGTVPGTSLIESLVAGMKDGERSYTMAIGPPLGSSYANEIARRIGISYEQIIEARSGNQR